MKSSIIKMQILFLLLTTSCMEKTSVVQEMLKLHPSNNHYFLFRGRPTLLITSVEHYGSVLNTDFNFELYLETLQKEGFNYTRIFAGPYSEMGSDQFGISNNTMNPLPGKWLTPWIREPSSQKYDLTAWNNDFFDRLKAFIANASEKGIVVEVTLFTSYYVNKHWEISPFYFSNNLQSLDSIPFARVNTLYNGKLMEYQEAYVRKMVQLLNPYDNVFFEIQNEPWSDNPNLSGFKNESDNKIFTSEWQKKVELANNVSLEWQKKIGEIITDEESRLPNKHLVAQNICNFGTIIQQPNPLVSICNFHYALPEAANENMSIAAVMALDETGFMPHHDFIYRKQAWEFILAGGALYNNLDYSFIVGKEDGTQSIDERTPGWGGPEFRKQIKVLKDFIESFDFISMKPDNSLLKERNERYNIQILACEGKQYAIYIHDGNAEPFALEIPDGTYQAEWVNPADGSSVRTETVIVQHGLLQMMAPDYKEDIALRLIKN